MKLGSSWKQGAAAVFVAGASLWNADAATVVYWGDSPDYVTGSQNLVLGTSTTSGGTRIYAYSSTTPVSPAANYTTPPGRSGIFYGGSYLTSSAGTAPTGWTSAAVTQNTTTDRLRYARDGVATSGITYSGAVFSSFLKANFLDGASASPIKFALDAGAVQNGSIRLDTASSTGATFRIALLNEGQWYLSETSSTTDITITNANILTSTWGLWNPVDSLNGNRLGAVPTTFSTLGSSFLNIQGFGVYTGLQGINDGNVASPILAFEVHAVPEPATVATIILSTAALFILRRRRLRL